MFQFRHRALLLAALLTLSQSALAQLASDGFSINRFDPSEHGSEWFALDSVDHSGELQPAFGFVVDWSSRPLTVEGTGDQVLRLVEDQVFAHLGGGVVIGDDLRIALNVPVALVNRGNSGVVDGVNFALNQGVALGDIRLAGDYRLYGNATDSLRISAGARLHFPTGSRDAFASDGAFRVVPQAMVAGDTGNWAYAARVGVQGRFGDAAFLQETFGAELQLGASAGYRFLDRKLLVGPEFYTSLSMSNQGNGSSGSTTPAEVILGAHYDATEEWRVGLGAGPGLTSGFGSPDFRVLASVEWVPAVEEADSDSDGILDSADACPHKSGAASKDPKKHGCPITDSDGDGVDNDQDACPNVMGVENEDPERNGCPEDPDKDGDSISDGVDACPEDAGEASEDPARHGCPIAQVRGDQIIITERVEFETGSSDLLASSDHILNAVLKVLKAHSEIEQINVEGHTDSRGGHNLNVRLSRSRAASVVKWLSAHGVDDGRLSSEGFGPDRPVADNDSEEGRQRNRRVEFHIQSAAQ